MSLITTKLCYLLMLFAFTIQLASMLNHDMSNPQNNISGIQMAASKNIMKILNTQDVNQKSLHTMLNEITIILKKMIGDSNEFVVTSTSPPTENQKTTSLKPEIDSETTQHSNLHKIPKSEQTTTMPKISSSSEFVESTTKTSNTTEKNIQNIKTMFYEQKGQKEQKNLLERIVEMHTTNSIDDRVLEKISCRTIIAFYGLTNENCTTRLMVENNTFIDSSTLPTTGIEQTTPQKLAVGSETIQSLTFHKQPILGRTTSTSKITTGSESTETTTQTLDIFGKNIQGPVHSEQ